MTEEQQAVLKQTVAGFREARQGKVFAFVGVPTPISGPPPHMLGVATLGEAGYVPIFDYDFQFPGYFPTPEAAWKAAEVLNGAMGLSSDAAAAVVADTMNRFQAAIDEEQGIASVRMSADEIDAVIEALDESFGNHDDLIDRLQEIREDIAPASPSFG